MTTERSIVLATELKVEMRNNHTNVDGQIKKILITENIENK